MIDLLIQIYLIWWICSYLLIETILISDDNYVTFTYLIYDDFVKDFFNLPIKEVVNVSIYLIFFPIFVLKALHNWIRQ